MTHAERITSTALIGTPSPSEENDAVVGCSKLAMREKAPPQNLDGQETQEDYARLANTQTVLYGNKYNTVLEDVSGSPLKSLENKPHWKKKNEPYTALHPSKSRKEYCKHLLRSTTCVISLRSGSYLTCACAGKKRMRSVAVCLSLQRSLIKGFTSPSCWYRLCWYRLCWPM